MQAMLVVTKSHEKKWCIGKRQAWEQILDKRLTNFVPTMFYLDELSFFVSVQNQFHSDVFHIPINLELEEYCYSRGFNYNFVLCILGGCNKGQL